MEQTRIRYYTWNTDVHWRATCNFNSMSRPFNSTPIDYMQHSLHDIDILASLYHYCVKLDYVNIRGYSLRNTYVYLLNHFDQHLSIDADRTYRTCGTHLPDTKINERCFGNYGHINLKFSCTANSASTTNWWIGSKIY